MEKKKGKVETLLGKNKEERKFFFCMLRIFTWKQKRFFFTEEEKVKSDLPEKVKMINS